MKNNYKETFKREFEMILAAGDSKNSSMEAIEKAKKYQFVEAREMLIKSENEMIIAHQLEKDLVVEEAKGASKNYGVLMMHAQDHLMTAIIFLELAHQLISVYEELFKLKGGK